MEITKILPGSSKKFEVLRYPTALDLLREASLARLPITGDCGLCWPIEDDGLGEVGLDCQVGDTGDLGLGKVCVLAGVGKGEGGMGDSGVVEKYRTDPPAPVFRTRFLGDLGDLGEPLGEVAIPGFSVLGVLQLCVTMNYYNCKLQIEFGLQTKSVLM